MRSVPDAILDRLENDKLRPVDQTETDGSFFYNPQPGQREFEDDRSEVEQLYYNRAQRIRQQFRAEFYPRSLHYIKWLLASVLFLAILQWAGTGQVNGQIIGITTSVVGSVVLGRSLLRGPYSVINETKTKVPTLSGRNMDSETLEYVRSTIDGINGLSYLILGFLIQLLSIFTA